MAGGNEKVKLLGYWESPYVIRVGVALNLKGVGYEFVEETRGCKSELLLNSNPVYKKVPTFLHDDKPICESLIIVEYIDQVWSSSGPALLPADPYDRAVARFWAHYIGDKWYPGIPAMVFAATEVALIEAVEQLCDGLHPLEEAFEKSSKGKGFFNGDTIGYLDIALGSNLGWVRVAETLSRIKVLDEEKTPLLVGWAERFSADAAVKELIPETDKLLEYRAAIRNRIGRTATTVQMK